MGEEELSCGVILPVGTIDTVGPSSCHGLTLSTLLAGSISPSYASHTAMCCLTEEMMPPLPAILLTRRTWIWVMTFCHPRLPVFSDVPLLVGEAVMSSCMPLTSISSPPCYSFRRAGDCTPTYSAEVISLSDDPSTTSETAESSVRLDSLSAQGLMSLELLALFMIIEIISSNDQAPVLDDCG